MNGSTRSRTMKTTAKNDKAKDKVDKLLAAIAKDKLRINTLETRIDHSLDVHNVTVQSVRDALRAAYEAGMGSVLNLL